MKSLKYTVLKLLKHSILYLFLLSLIPLNLSAMRPFFLLSIPKCGTHLVQKMLVLLTRKVPIEPAWFLKSVGAYTFYEDAPRANAEADYIKFEKIMAGMAGNNEFACSHLNFSQFFQKFYEKNPQYQPIIIVRDLRDACVSLVYYQWNEIETAIGPSSFDQKLKWVIAGNYGITRFPILNIKKNAREAAQWKQCPEALFIKFENLVGPEGGGSTNYQVKEITSTANMLGIPINQTLIAQISANIFGTRGPPVVNGTFRSGQIGSWKKHFNKEHVKAFRKHLGDYQKILGYSY